jgi:hypothetical protein
MLSEIYNWLTEGFARGESVPGRIGALSHYRILRMSLVDATVALAAVRW